jgi:hypothetical protein
VTDSSLRAEISREIVRCENGAQLLQFTFTPGWWERPRCRLRTSTPVTT